MQNRVVKTIGPECQLASIPYASLIAYDGLGRATSTTDANGAVTAFTYNDNSDILTVRVGGALTQANTD